MNKHLPLPGFAAAGLLAMVLAIAVPAVPFVSPSIAYAASQETPPNFFQKLGRALSKLFRRDPPTTPAGPRGPDTPIFVIGPKGGTRVEGDTIELQWENGQPPFTIEVGFQGQTQPFLERGIAADRAAQTGRQEPAEPFVFRFALPAAADRGRVFWWRVTSESSDDSTPRQWFQQASLLVRQWVGRRIGEIEAMTPQEQAALTQELATAPPGGTAALSSDDWKLLARATFYIQAGYPYEAYRALGPIKDRNTSLRSLWDLLRETDVAYLRPALSGPQIVAVVIGISDYESPEDRPKPTGLKNLPKVAGEIDQVHKFLQGQPGYSDANVKMLINKNAQMQSIKDALEGRLPQTLRRVREAGEETTLLLYVSGHGVAPSGGVAKFIPYDGGRRVRNNAPASWEGIRFDEFDNLLGDSWPHAQQALLFFDYCHSGTMSENFFDFENWRYRQRPDVWVLCASRPREMAFDGMFTPFLLRALRNQLVTENRPKGVLAAGQLKNWVNTNVFDASGLKQTVLGRATSERMPIIESDSAPLSLRSGGPSVALRQGPLHGP